MLTNSAGIDFEKGCYVGQEVTARMHYKAIDKKGIYHATAESLITTGRMITCDGKEAGALAKRCR